MQIQLSDHFTYGKLLRFTLPSIVTMIFTSIYSVVDGLFVSNLVGELALSAVNIIFPVSMIFAAFGFMLGSGGSAIVARTMGEGKPELANRYFTMIILCVVGLGTVFSVVGALLIEPIARLAGASELLMDFQVFCVTAELPKMGLAVSLASGATNIVMDYVLIALCDMGIAGAAWGTVLSYVVGGGLPLLYFLRPKRGKLRLCHTRLYPRELKNACVNGSSELMSNLSASLISVLYNLQLMRLVGESGVAAYSVMMYVDFAFAAVFLGFSMGVGPVISFHFGADNREELKGLLRRSLTVIFICSLAMVALSELLARPLAAAFVGYSPALMDMTVHGFRIFALSYLFVGFGIFGSGLFTDLCNGFVSALISFLRTFLFRGGMVFLLPLALKLDGIWLAVVVADGLGAVVALALIWSNRERYHYLP